MKEVEFNIKYKCYELRACDKHLCNYKEKCTIELVKWDETQNGESYCYTIAFFYKNDEGWTLYFVADRFFRDINDDDKIEILKFLEQAYYCLENLNVE